MHKSDVATQTNPNSPISYNIDVNNCFYQNACFHVFLFVTIFYFLVAEIFNSNKSAKLLHKTTFG